MIFQRPGGRKTTRFSSFGLFQALAYWPQQDRRVIALFRYVLGQRKGAVFFYVDLGIFWRAWISNWKHPGWSLRGSIYRSLEMFITFVGLETFGSLKSSSISGSMWKKSEILVHEQKLSMEIRTCGCQIQSPLAFLMVKRPWWNLPHENPQEKLMYHRHHWNLGQ